MNKEKLIQLLQIMSRIEGALRQVGVEPAVYDDLGEITELVVEELSLLPHEVCKEVEPNDNHEGLVHHL